MFSYGEKKSMKKFVYLLLPLFSLFLAGCQSNKYEEYYSILADNDHLRVDEPASWSRQKHRKFQNCKQRTTISLLALPLFMISEFQEHLRWIVQKKYGACLVVFEFAI